MKQLPLDIKKFSKTFKFCFSMAYHDYHHTMSRSRSPINCNVQHDSPDHNIQVVSSHVSGSAPGYQASSEGYGYSQNFENYYDPSGYLDYADPYAQSGHDVHCHYDHAHSYAQYNEPQYSSHRRVFYAYQHYEQQRHFHHDVPHGFGADMQPNRQAHNMAPFHCDVHQTQNTIKIETGENKTVPNPNSNLKGPSQPTHVTTIKKEVEAVEILSSDEENVKDNAKDADSKTTKCKLSDSNSASKKCFHYLQKVINHQNLLTKQKVMMVTF